MNPKIDLKPGKYYLDISQENYHSFQHFNLELRVSNDSFELIFLSSEEFGYSKLWNRGDVYAIGNLNHSNADGIDLEVWENRGDVKVLTKGYWFKPLADGFQIILKTKRKDYIDHYSTAPHQFWLDADSIVFLPDPPEDLERYHLEIENSLNDFGILKTDDWTEYLSLLEQAQEIDFPYQNIPTHREFLTRMGFSLAYRLFQTGTWKWALIKEHRNAYLGWTIINPAKKIALPMEHYFFLKLYKFRAIKFNELMEVVNDDSVVIGHEKRIFLYEPWMNYEEY